MAGHARKGVAGSVPDWGTGVDKRWTAALSGYSWLADSLAARVVRFAVSVTFFRSFVTTVMTSVRLSPRCDREDRSARVVILESRS